MMIDFERGRFEDARERCNALVEIGDKLREGSEGPFAHALAGLCDYAIDDDDASMDAALEDLRVVDAKHRLAYTLTRAAMLDLERGRLDSAVTRATEALEYATLLQRATETILAHIVLARANSKLDNAEVAAEHESAIAKLSAAGVAKWAMAYVGVSGETSKTDAT